MNIRDVAISGAKKICGSGQCICGFDCGHSNKAPAALPKVGTETVCPLARYEVEPQPVSDPFGPPVTQLQAKDGPLHSRLKMAAFLAQVQLSDTRDAMGWLEYLAKPAEKGAQR